MQPEEVPGEDGCADGGIFEPGVALAVAALEGDRTVDRGDADDECPVLLFWIIAVIVSVSATPSPKRMPPY